MVDNFEKIDTQGMSGPATPESISKAKEEAKHKPMQVIPRRLFTPEYVKEMKILINEVLDEREHKRRCIGAYDHIKELPPSYFDTDHFKYRVGEEEPSYEDWSQ